MPSNGTIANVLLRNPDFYFQGQIVSCHTFVIRNARAADVPADVPADVSADVPAMFQRMSQQICDDSHGPRRGVALVYTVS